ncbi:LytR C-terminal domain-containing protein [Streptomyces sp. RS10V-4]|uniref:LCP family protein n=1 Tax=Streptomyces rhizoryzae TaxID=2932493 RepID=UPI002003601A|nr:LCP family protein [Streptomyces rhizoryzae]MCK7626915.1 LytR C-terminal domain-containing protein [Streptomyces rhizoryzae]
MSDRQDPYGPQDPYAQDPYAQQHGHQGRPEQPGHQGHAYDAYGRPVPQEAPQPYGAQQTYGQQQSYGQQHYDPYGQPAAPAAAPPYDPYDPYAGAGHQTPPDGRPYRPQEYGYDPYGAPQAPQQPGYPQQYDPYAQPQQQPQHADWIPHQAQQPAYEQVPEQAPYGQPHHAQPQEQAPAAAPEEPPAPAAAPAPHGAPGPGTGPDGEEYHTEQFSFVEEPDEDSEDVIDWLKFTESRTERREEAKRRGRSRLIALSVVLALLVAGGVGYLWWAGKLPGLSGGSGGAAAEAGGQKRDVLVVNLRDTKTGTTSTALLVDNETTHKGTTLLLPNSLIVPKDDGTTTTLGKSVKDDGTDATRESLNTLLGADLNASWRLDTPYLENLVETVGGITVDTDTAVPGAKKDDDPVVKQGAGQLLNGQAAVAYATYQGPGETQTKQLARFGQVMQATLKKVSSDADGATATVKSLLQILDPPLTEAQLGSSLAQRAELAKTGKYATEVLPVQADGTLGQGTAAGVVKDILGGTVKKTSPGVTPRVAVRNATGDKAATGKAQVALLNGGYTFVDDGSAGTAPASQVTYGDAPQRAKAAEVAKTLGLPAGAVRQGKVEANADIAVVLGQDYKG